MLRFSRPVEGAALQKHVIKRIALDSEHSCRVHCYLENTCVSYNFGKRASGEDVCELNNATHTEHPSDLKTTSNFIYRGSEVECYFFLTLFESLALSSKLLKLCKIFVVFTSFSQLIQTCGLSYNHLLA